MSLPRSTTASCREPATLGRVQTSLCAFTGLRRGEVAGLRWADLDLDRAVLHIETQLTQLGWEVAEDTPKTEASAAPVRLDKDTVALMRAWRKAQVADQLAMAGDWIRSGRVFTHIDGSALHPAQITSRFERAEFDAQLPPIMTCGTARRRSRMPAART